MEKFKAFPIQDDEHLITVARYVERNPPRAGLVERAEDWPWSSLGAAKSAVESPPRLADEDVLRRADWASFVNRPMQESETEAVRRDRLLLRMMQDLFKRKDCKLISVRCFHKAFDADIPSISAVAGWAGFGGELADDKVEFFVSPAVQNFRKTDR